MGFAIGLCSVLVLSPRAGNGQAAPKSPAEVIRDAAQLLPLIAGTCGEFYHAAEQDQSDLETLVRFGAPAVPAIDAALDSIDKGNDPEFRNISGLLLTADARRKGAGGTVTAGAAASFQPEQALNLMILAWEKGDLALLEDSLGPNARAGLVSLLRTKDGTWDYLRARLWPITLTNRVAVGYRFEGPSSSSEKFGTFPDSKPGQVEYYRGDREFDTAFKDGAGKDCGRRRIRFMSPDLAIETPDIEDLLKLISRCASNQ